MLEIEKVKELLDRGLSSHGIAAELGVSQTLIVRFVKKNGLSFNGYSSVAYRKRVDERISRMDKCLECGKPVNKGVKKCAKCWDHGKIPVLNHKNPAKELRKILIEKRGHKCENCGISLWQDYPITLELHHKDGNSKNNDDSNLQLLCPNCHSQSWDYRFTMNKVSSRREDRYETERSLAGREV